MKQPEALDSTEEANIKGNIGINTNFHLLQEAIVASKMIEFNPDDYKLTSPEKVESKELI